MTASDLRQIRHPGPIARERITALPCRVSPVTLNLRAGTTVAEGLSAAATEAGFSAAYLHLRGVSVAPLAYVIPAPAPGDGHAAWYSDTHVKNLNACIVQGGAHLGLRDRAPFVHCHGLWDSVEGSAAMGHLLPSESVVAAKCTVTGWGIDGAVMDVAYDEETRFALFRPTARPARGASAGGARALLCTLRPNQDIIQALAMIGFQNARVEGIGSLVGTVFAQGRGLNSYATEMLVLNGRITNGEPRLRVASVGFDGQSAVGWLVPDKNAVCVTAELLVIEDEEAG